MNKLTEDEKRQLQVNAQRVMAAFADHMEEGFDSSAIQALVDEQFTEINEKFYDCSLEMFRNLAVMTIEDERYARNYRCFHPDLPEFRLQAVQYYCDHHADQA